MRQLAFAACLVVLAVQSTTHAQEAEADMPDIVLITETEAPEAPVELVPRGTASMNRRLHLLSTQNRRLLEQLEQIQADLDNAKPEILRAKQLEKEKAEAEMKTQQAKTEQAAVGVQKLKALRDLETVREQSARAAAEEAREREGEARAAAANASAFRQLAEASETQARQAAEASRARTEAVAAEVELEQTRLLNVKEAKAAAELQAKAAKAKAEADAQAVRRAEAELRLARAAEAAAKAKAAEAKEAQAASRAQADAATARARAAKAESAAEIRRANLLEKLVQDASAGAAGQAASNTSLLDTIARRLEDSFKAGGGLAAAASAATVGSASGSAMAEAVRSAASQATAQALDEHHAALVASDSAGAGNNEHAMHLNRTLESALPRISAAVADHILGELLGSNGDEGASALAKALQASSMHLDADSTATVLQASAQAEARRLAAVTTSLTMASGASQTAALENARLSAETALAEARTAEARAAAAASEELAAAHTAALADSEARAAEAAMATAQAERDTAAAAAAAAKTAVEAATARAQEAVALERARTAATEEASVRVRSVTAAIALATAETERARANATAQAALRHRAELDEARARAEEAAARARTAQADAEARAARMAAHAADARAASESAALKRANVELSTARAKVDAAKAEAAAVSLRLELAGAVRLNTTQQVALAEAEAARAEVFLLSAEANVSLEAARTAQLQAAERSERAREAAERARGEAERVGAAEARETERLRAELQRNVTMEAAAEQDRLARAREAERVRLEREARQEAEEARRATEVRLAELKMDGEAEVAKARAEVEAKARIEQERANEDVHTRQRAEQAKAEHARWLAVVKESASIAADAGKAIVGPYLGRTVSAVLLLALSIYGSREALSFAGKAAAARLGKPKLVRETSVGSTPFLDGVDAAADALTLGLTAWLLPDGVTASLRQGSGAQSLEASFADVVLPAELRGTVLGLARATRNAKANHAPLRHALFYGPPGTGKTMAAQRLARSVGLDYAVMAGGDVAPLAAEAVTELHRLFEWAKRSRRGLLLFIDEAEAFLGARDRAGGVSEHLRNVLSALLYQTGEQSAHYMLVLCTNRPEDLDAAVTDRIDQSLRFGLPEAPQRVDMVWQYFRQHVLRRALRADVDRTFGPEWHTLPAKALASAAEVSPGASAASTGHTSKRAHGRDLSLNGGTKLKAAALPMAHSGPHDSRASASCCSRRQPPQISIAECVTPTSVASLAKATEGFSGRQIGKLMLNVQGAVYASEDVTLRSAMIDAVLLQERRKHANKARAEEAARKEAEATGRHTAFLGGWD